MNIRWDQIDSLVEISIGTAAVIVLLLAAGVLLRQRYTMRWRVLAWMLVAVRLLIPVHFGRGLPSVEIPIRPVPSAASVPEPVSSVPAAAQQAQPDSAAESGSASASGTGRPTGQQGNAGQSSDFGESQAKPVPVPGVVRTLNLPQIIGQIWLTGALALLTFHATGGLLYRRRVRKSAQPCDTAVTALLVRCAAEIGLRRPVQAAVAAVPTPLALAGRRPMLLLPSSVCTLPRDALRMVLLHELIHLRRHDTARKWLVLAAACVHWFNPLAWGMVRAAGQDMESVCDDGVLAVCGDACRADYCRLLLAVAGRAPEK